jgi:hypothetical protein
MDKADKQADKLDKPQPRQQLSAAARINDDKRDGHRCHGMGSLTKRPFPITRWRRG